MRLARVIAAVAVWLVVVTGASTLVWVVISRAGEEVVSSEQPLVATTGTSTPPPSTPPPTSAPAAGERRTWQGLGGLLIAECDGAAVGLVSAQPIDGFIAEIKNDGPEELEIEFEGREDESGSSATVVARCMSGVPDFSTEIENKD